MKPIVVVAPDYTHTSNGVKALHNLCHTINMLGGTARMLMLTDKEIVSALPNQLHPFWNTHSLLERDARFLQDGIVLYPEVVKGNPLNARHVVRWMGNKEGVLRGKNGMDAQPDDFILAHSKVIRSNADFVLFYSSINKCFNADGAIPEDRVMNATYIGKGYLYKDPVSIIKDTLWIDRKWPCTQEQLAFLFRHLACLYTWDCWSATNVDAILCGVVPFFLQYNPFTSEEIDAAELGIIPRLDNEHREFNLDKFMSQRADMIARIDYFENTWDQRVREFMEKLEKRFGN